LKKNNIYTFLVTGGAGFIGSHIVDELIQRGHKVIVIDDLSTGFQKNINNKSIFFNIDLKDFKKVRSIFENYEIDFIIHQAAKINLNIKLEDPIHDVNSSILNTINLLQCCVDFNIKKFTYASSVAVYGRPQKLPVSEMDLLSPIYSYGIAKKCSEDYIQYFSEEFGINYTILRYANVYGPRQPIFGEVGLIAIYIKNIIEKRPLIIFGDGEHLRDYIFIADAVDCTLLSIFQKDNQIYNVATGIGTSVNKIYKIFNETFESKPVLIKKPERVGELGKFYCDISKLKELIKEKEFVSLDEGVKKTQKYYSDS